MFIHSTSFGSLPWPLPRYLSCESESQSQCNEVCVCLIVIFLSLSFAPIKGKKKKKKEEENNNNKKKKKKKTNKTYFAKRFPVCRIFAGRAISKVWRGGRARQTWICSFPVVNCSSCWWEPAVSDRYRRQSPHRRQRVSRWCENGDLSSKTKQTDETKF